jgi:peptidoglycan/xylan/chitin deacetylase (PgdA/CDA1 family)
MQYKTYENVKKVQGGIVRMDPLESKVYLVFAAHDTNDGGKTIEKILRRNHVRASFFFTGDFYRNPENQKLIRRLREEGNYLGPHSDKHLLYADWTDRDSLLVTHDEFTNDMRNNIKAMEAIGIPAKEVTVFMPPYEWYNRAIADWGRDLGLTLIDFTTGIRTNADYTTPDMKNYRSSDQLYNDLLQFEQTNPGGLNGCIILIHLGTSSGRKDKFYDQLGKVIHFLKENNYQTNRF